MNAADPRDAMDAPADRFCDIVMEGGITSGIIYASAVVKLARHYRFSSIGGSSIGAFAAALTAAAEYRRRNGSADGFDKLASLPDKLALEEGGRTLLERLFVPQKSTRRPFRIFLAMLERGGPVCAVLSGVNAAIGQYRWRIVVVALLLFLLVLAGPILTAFRCVVGLPAAECSGPFLSLAAATLMAFGVAVVLGVVSGLAYDLGYATVRNGFGLCRGWQDDAKPDRVDLAGFLHKSIQEVAGRKVDDLPLTFRDLWDAPGSARQALGLPAHGGTRSINLEVYASNLAHSRPYRFPLEVAEDMGHLFFLVEELERYFPKGIVQFLAGVSKPYQPRHELDPPLWAVGPRYLEVPVEDLPIVVAARLAMSFPLLISAVPLYAVNHRRRRIERCWMSDGGLCSNFPIHLFDSFLPMWPTFGISLDSRARFDRRRVWLPKFHTSGRGDTWDDGPEESSWKLAAFLLSLWKTTWRWNDSTMMRMPGVRDRVVRIYLADGEGGVNIRMGARKIAMLGARYGTPAAQAFIDKFLAPDDRGWREHRYVRFNSLLVSLRARIRNFGAAVALDRHTLALRDQLAAALASPPLGKAPGRSESWPSELTINPAQFQELATLVAALCSLEQAFQWAGDTEPYRAIPKPSLRIRHPT
jgi:predicted acylesterase/phospholipase RssA